MKLTPLLFTIGFIILLAGGYYLYDQVLNRPPIRPWDIVPAETVFVYEKDVCASCIDEMQKSPVWTIASQASFQSRPLDSLKTRLNALIANSKNLLISAHITRKDDFDFVYYLPDPEKILQPSAIMPLMKGYRYTERELNSVKIHELSLDKNTLSWIVIDNVWVCSFTPFLIEDVVRTYKGKPGFSRVNPEVKKLPRISGDVC